MWGTRKLDCSLRSWVGVLPEVHLLVPVFAGRLRGDVGVRIAALLCARGWSERSEGTAVVSWEMTHELSGGARAVCVRAYWVCCREFLREEWTEEQR